VGMNALDFHHPPPRVRTLEEAQALIDQIWSLGQVVQDLQVTVHPPLAKRMPMLYNRPT